MSPVDPPPDERETAPQSSLGRSSDGGSHASEAGSKNVQLGDSPYATGRDSPPDERDPHDDRDPHGGHDPHDGHDPHEHRSRWPLVAALGAGGLYSGVAIYLLGAAAGVAPPLLGVVLAVGGALVMLTGIAGWLEEAFFASTREAIVRRSSESIRKTRESYVSTTVMFLVTDIGTFGAVFVYYFFIRLGEWPPPELPPLVTSLVLANTLILLASSVTIHYAHEALVDGARRRFLGLLGITLGLGVVFLAGQALEYYEFIVAEGFTLSTGIFGSAFFGLTGLHGLHVALGVVAIALLFWRGVRGHYGPERDTGVATVSIYWHFVDAVWLFLVVVLYGGGALS